ncbi:MAG: YcgL domain-containing protein [Thiomicrorhabdus sp.]|nr:YcgL domain-containing protein [Thiomicrorhabdus sp.]
MTPIIVSTYKSPKKPALYLFISKEAGLDSLADELLVMFGEPEHIIDFDLTPDRKMPRDNAQDIYEALQTKGYFMQMPPTEIEKISDMPPPPPHLDNIF